eukprot:CAMPEP_0170558294 /NCGR_PEP_ID=MMETSP0211-20121228/34265_1 /TAXON_ID=311385 /ORGANISM="Pseudokeronopsis sp., Strain OXSARD2" /LENGTH=45 /DNA_ID= /DNA_START= /DNA_END= /DNA_ORIENTATION=
MAAEIRPAFDLFFKDSQGEGEEVKRKLLKEQIIQLQMHKTEGKEE